MIVIGEQPPKVMKALAVIDSRSRSTRAQSPPLRWSGL
jgi:hypothetical protein